MSAPTFTRYFDAAPRPRVEVLFSSFTAGTASVTVYRMAGGREQEMRGAINAAVAGALTRIDIEIPFGVDVSYRAEQFDASGVSLGFTASGVTNMNVAETWIHNPLDPQGATTVSFHGQAVRSIVRRTEGEVVHPKGRRVGVLVSGQRRGIEGVDLTVTTDTIEQVDKLQAMFGSYTNNLPPILCICVGSNDRIRLPRPFFAAVMAPDERDVNYAMGIGTQIVTEMIGDEVAPPAPGILIPLLTNADINAFYATNADINTAENNLAINRSYNLIGASA
jgi:hypothetical protein